MDIGNFIPLLAKSETENDPPKVCLHWFISTFITIDKKEEITVLLAWHVRRKKSLLTALATKLSSKIEKITMTLFLIVLN